MFRLIHIPKTGGTSLRVSGIFGEHGIGYDKNFTNIIIVRDPIKRTLSHFKEQGKGDLITWFGPEYYNYQTNYLLKVLKVNNLNEIKKFIKEKEVILIPTDELTKRMQKLGVTIPHVNKARREYIPTKEEVEIIEKNSKLDRELYNFSKKLSLKSV